MRYWIYANDVSKGPYDLAQLKDTPGFNPESLVCPEGAAGGRDWAAAKSRPELQLLFSQGGASSVCPTCGHSLLDTGKPLIAGSSAAPASGAKHWVLPVVTALGLIGFMLFALPRILSKPAEESVQEEKPAPPVEPAPAASPQQPAAAAFVGPPMPMHKYRRPMRKKKGAEAKATPTLAELKAIKPAKEVKLPKPSGKQEFLLPGVPKIPPKAPVSAKVAPVASAASSQGGKCTVPDFYAALPSDPDWYFGAAKAEDDEKARTLALLKLSKQVIGGVAVDLKEGEIEEIAGSGHERMDVANQVGELIGASSLLADTREDTRQTCEADHYVLVKVEKQRVFDFIKEDSQFKKDLAARLSEN